ncbi:MAG TPA: TlpA disulfide reductase family protein [Thermoanaerobaculia bacterium]|nr:TlpA disulfide reductase family protein [Thermoanaerobaculia bacterium]
MRRQFRMAVATFSILPVLAATPVSAAVDVGQPAPALVVPEVGGGTFDLSAQRGKVVILNLWATWCPPCRQEIPVLDAFYRGHRDRGVELLGLSMDRGRDRDAVKKVQSSVSYPIALAADAKTNGFGSWRVLPVTYVVDATGIVRALILPEKTSLTDRRLEELVLPLLSP